VVDVAAPEPDMAVRTNGDAAATRQPRKTVYVHHRPVFVVEAGPPVGMALEKDMDTRHGRQIVQTNAAPVDDDGAVGEPVAGVGPTAGTRCHVA
jgi:hypothetical protein